ncbi:hybrid sensor histidine kinase/response regulator [Paraburkholderia ferrariae]|uniref:hybrid sensor histidine kinase/response regulator n=1 Tax=Paraburkholderia ferrariae TaxID=386056 RepID=UPI000486FA41|nr:hybrid sensor histidine kinase/response regulator [Paraburkholderia ferrariae]
MPTSTQSNSLNQLHRYQRPLMLGGGVLVTVVVLLAFALQTLLTINSFVSQRRQTFNTNFSLVNRDIEATEFTIRSAVVRAQLASQGVTPANRQVIEAFRSGDDRLVFQPHHALRAQLLLGSRMHRPSDEAVKRFLPLAVEIEAAYAGDSASGNQLVAGYFFSPDGSLTSLIPAPSAESQRGISAFADRDMLIAELMSGVARSLPTRRSGALNERPFVQWLEPSISPSSGQSVLRVVAPAYSEGELVAVLVAGFDPLNLIDTIPDVNYKRSYRIVSGNGHVIAQRDGEQAEAMKMESSLSNYRKNMPASSGLVQRFQGGALIISQSIGETGLTLVYVLPGREIAAGIWPQVSAAVAAMAVIIGMTWFLILSFNRRVFLPVLERSQRVFDSERLNRTMIQSGPVGLGLIAGRSAGLLLCSPVWVEMESRVVVDGAPSLAARLAAHYSRIARPNALAHGTVAQADVPLLKLDGEPVSLAVSFAPGRYQGEDVLVIAFIDVTAKAQLEQRLRDAKREADQANAAKSIFLATMSHEIRTPLSAIVGNLELLAHSPLDAMQQARVDTMRHSSDGLLATLRDVLDFSKIEAGETVLEHIGFDAVEVISPALLAFAPMARAKGVGLYGAFDAPGKVPMMGDPTRLRQILNNLLSNAIKFTEQGSVTVRVAVEVTRCGSRELRLAIEDTGIGMTAAQRSTVFHAFAQADASINRRFGGTGLGLALCGRLAQALGGAIDVQSEPGRGSCFTVRLPLGVAEPEADSVQTRFAGESIVLLASDVGWLRCMTPLLKAWGLRVTGYLAPSHVTEQELEAADVLMLCGDRDQWAADAENALIEQISCVIDCGIDGPLHPVRVGRIVSVSCHAPAGLRAAFAHALRGAPLPQSAQKAVATKVPPSCRRMRVLVAEDNEVNRQLFADQLAMLQCDARVAASGSEALRLLSQQRFDILLTDLHMPEMDGYALTHAVRKRWPDLPVAAVTAGVTQAELARCEEAGMAASATKPLSLQGLYELLVSTVGVAAGSRDALALPEGIDSRLLTGGIELSDDAWETFERTYGSALEALRAARAVADLSRVRQELHSLKGALAVFGYKNLAAQCETVEMHLELDGYAAWENVDTLLETRLYALIE